MLFSRSSLIEMKTLTEAGPLYTGLAQGDVDIYPSAWPELTHAEYMDTYGDDIEDLGAYYDNAKLTIAVPEYSELNSIADLAGRRIAVPLGSSAHYFATRFLAEADVDAELIQTGPAEIVTAITNRDVDAVAVFQPALAKVVAALRDFGRRNMGTPFEIASTPVRAAQPEEKARMSKKAPASPAKPSACPGAATRS